MTIAVILLSLVVAALGRHVIVLDKLSRQQFAAFTAEHEKLTEALEALLYVGERLGQIDAKADAKIDHAVALHRELSRYTSAVTH